LRRIGINDLPGDLSEKMVAPTPTPASFRILNMHVRNLSGAMRGRSTIRKILAHYVSKSLLEKLKNSGAVCDRVLFFLFAS